MYNSDIQEISTNFLKFIAQEDDDQTAIINLVKLYNTWLQQTLFNCKNSGYGSNPTDLTDADGSVCTGKNLSLKCRIHHQFIKLFSSYAGDNTLTFPEPKA